MLLKAKFIHSVSNVNNALFQGLIPQHTCSCLQHQHQREEYRSVTVEISFRIFFRDWLGQWKKNLWLKHVAASFKCVAAFSNVQQHGEISIIHFTFIVILFLPCLFWCYPLFQCVYKSSNLFLYFCLSVLL